MKRHDQPSFEPRRSPQLLRELRQRAQTWLPEWQPGDASADFGQALLQIAARLSSEVTQRLDRAPEKLYRGFLDWLAVRGQARRGARIPVVFDLPAGAEAVAAGPGVKLQAIDTDPPVVFETERDLLIVPAHIACLVATDPAQDRYFQPPPGLLTLGLSDARISEWRLQSDVLAGALQLQLEPAFGLEPGLRLRERSSRQQYSVTAAENGIVTIEPPVGEVDPAYGGNAVPAQGLSAGTSVLERVTQFEPFSPNERNRQRHELYIAADNALNIESTVTIDLLSREGLVGDAQWHYWGKAPRETKASWKPLKADKVATEPGVLRLTKQSPGAIEKTDIAGSSSRWLRARRAAAGTEGPTPLAGLKLRINCLQQAASTVEELKAEGIANTAPLVLDAPFYPLGRLPRQFDAFYLGCEEVFSKPKARAKLEFKMGTSLSGAPIALSYQADSEAQTLIAGIGGDGRLHRAVFKPTPEPVIEHLRPSQPVGTSGRNLVFKAGVRPGAVLQGVLAHFSAAKEAEVWLGKLNTKALKSEIEWSSLGALPAVDKGTPAAPKGFVPVIHTVLARQDGRVRVYATHQGELLARDAGLGGKWERLEPAPGKFITCVVPIVHHDVLPGQNDDAHGIAVLTADGRLLYRVADEAWKLAEGPALDGSCYPLVARAQSGELVAFGQGLADLQGTRHIHAFTLDGAVANRKQLGPLQGHGFDFVIRDKRILALFVVTALGEAEPLAARWDAFGDGSLFLDVTPAGEALVEAPLVMGSRVASKTYPVFARRSGAFFVRELVADASASFAKAPLGIAALFTSNRNWDKADNLLIDLTPAEPVSKRIVRVDGKPLVLEPRSGSEQALLLKKPTDAEDGVAGIYEAKHPTLWKGMRLAAKEVQLKDGDGYAVKDGLLYIEWSSETRIYKIKSVTTAPGSAKRTAVLTQPLPDGVTGFRYQNVSLVEKPSATFRPCAKLDSAKPTFFKAMQANGVVRVESLLPARQIVRAVDTARKLVILRDRWTKGPQHNGNYTVVADAAFGAWLPFAPARPPNPDLSWEYWNGAGWWQLPEVIDETADFVKDGNVSFCVPEDLAPTDVAGRTKHWVRARLVGGDYGQEAVIVDSEPGDKKNRQIIRRDPDAVLAPIVAELKLSYELCCPVFPDHLLTHDSGGWYDHTAANRSSDAVVPYFVPLAQTLARLHRLERTDSHAAKRALFIGIDAPLRGGPISMLFLVDEHASDHDPYPLQLDVLGEQGFVPVAVQDQTRGLTESGVLIFTLDVPPPQLSLFGQALRWLRLRPRDGFDEQHWQPAVRAAYLNAGFALAGETQTLELLGSSDGSPYQRVTLARPPLIAKSLRLRVRERLSDEQIDALRAEGIDVAQSIGTRAGPWVLWTEVNDTDDATSGERVYSLDDETGDIRFGNGLQGSIPPVGRDCILAEVYRSGGGERANHVKAWGQLTLVTPLPGVTQVAAPEGASGGADAQGSDETLRYASANLATRDRAVTLRDLEVLTLQFSRDVAQVRALPAGVGARVVVIMRGPDPLPSRAVRRELPRYLAARCMPSMARRGALSVVGPTLRRIRIELALTVDGIENGGAVSRNAVRRLQALLDPAAGGLDGQGWPLAQLPSAAEIAAALAEIVHLDGVSSAQVFTLSNENLATAAVAPLRATELAVLDADGVHINLEDTHSEAQT